MFKEELSLRWCTGDKITGDPSTINCWAMRQCRNTHDRKVGIFLVTFPSRDNATAAAGFSATVNCSREYHALDNQSGFVLFIFQLIKAHLQLVGVSFDVTLNIRTPQLIHPSQRSHIKQTIQKYFDCFTGKNILWSTQFVHNDYHLIRYCYIT